jgi:diaminopimelate epimerase
VDVEREPPIKNLPLELDGQTVPVTCVSVGNPHAVHFWARGVESYPLDALGPKVEHHPLFPARVNFEVARVVDRGRIESRTWERGVGETLSCGSGASAVMVAARLQDMVGERVEVAQPGGVLTLEWDGSGDIYLEGPAAEVFQGDWPE